MCGVFRISANNTWPGPVQTSPDALSSHRSGLPPDAETIQVSQANCPSTVAYEIRFPSGENTGLIFCEVIVRQLNWLAVRERFHIDLAGRERDDGAGRSPNEREHPAIRRQRRMDHRVGKPRQLDPLRAVGRTSRVASHSAQRQRQHRDHGCRNRRDPPPVPSALRLFDRPAGVARCSAGGDHVLVETLSQEDPNARGSGGRQRLPVRLDVREQPHACPWRCRQ